MNTRLANRSRSSSRPAAFAVEILEGRRLLSTFEVTSLGDSGAGSFRAAILGSNARPGADVIDFEVSGTIKVGRASLPAITDPVTIDGSTDPTVAGSTAVTVDFRGTRGLLFAAGSDGSTLRSLSLVKAGNSGVTLDASRVTVAGNDIGLLADGRTAAGNRGDGIRIDASSSGDLIGRGDPVSGVDFDGADSVSLQPVTAWQGIRSTGAGNADLIVGTSGSSGLLYLGPISGSGGTSFAVNYPGAKSTSVYGPDDLGDGSIRLVGSDKSGDDTVRGFLYQGTTAGLSTAANYVTIDYPGAMYTYVHSTMGDLAVGNADGPEGDAPLGTGHAFLYDVASKTILPDIVYPGSTTTTAYGVWSDGGTSYTICGGYSAPGSANGTVSDGYIVDYDASTGRYSHWASFAYPNGVVGQDYITHFEGISGAEKGVYTLVADSVQSGSSHPAQGSFVTVRRNTDGSFGPASWVDLNYPGLDPTTNVVSANSVAGNQVVGIVAGPSGTFSYQATVNAGFQLSNVISGNGGNGIGIYGASDNQISMNDIGTDVTGTVKVGNARSGILVTRGASRNMIGGQATGGNDPTAGVFVRPPQGNLISGNGAAGVRIDRGSTANTLSGNFIGTTADGNFALGNRLDGVTIDHADGNRLIGCTFRQDPFVFYNVISGNGGEGLRVTDANDTTIQANFLGVGANNGSIVANRGDGLLVSGSSADTQVGGVIPLGNVISGNDRNGIEETGTASGLVSFNTFAGLFAFGSSAPNRLDGIKVTSRGGDNTIRTCIVSGNLGNGIELGGDATGVQVTETAVGTNTSIMTALPNRGDGIRIAGRAHGNAIGGFQPSIEPQVTISSNGGHGIAVVGSARDNSVLNTYVGTNYDATASLGNALGGIFLGPGTSSTTIGGTSSADQVKILDNSGDGVSIRSSRGNRLAGDLISGNLGYGVSATGPCTGSVLARNSITSNARGDVDLSKSTGVVTIF